MGKGNDLGKDPVAKLVWKLAVPSMLAQFINVLYGIVDRIYIGNIPIVVGAALYGWAAGGWLGLVFGAMVLFTGGANAFLVINVPGTIITVLVKGAAAGLVPGLIYKALENKNRWAATICAAAAAPIVNTGIFLLGCLAFFMDTISEWAAGVGVENAGVYMVTAFVGVNFLVELGANLLLSSVIVRIVDIVKNKLSSNKQGL